MPRFSNQGVNVSNIRYPDGKRDEFRKLRAMGVSLREISKMIDVPFPTVCYWSRTMDVASQNAPIHRAPHPPEKKAAFRGLYRQGIQPKKISDTIGIPYQTCLLYTSPSPRD